MEGLSECVVSCRRISSVELLACAETGVTLSELGSLIIPSISGALPGLAFCEKIVPKL